MNRYYMQKNLNPLITSRLQVKCIKCLFLEYHKGHLFVNS